jgi:hypothetical protein
MMPVKVKNRMPEANQVIHRPEPVHRQEMALEWTEFAVRNRLLCCKRLSSIGGEAVILAIRTGAAR